MQYIRKTFDKYISYGDENIGNPPDNEDYLAMKLFTVKNNIKDFAYNISVYIPEGNCDNLREDKNRENQKIIELRYVEPYAHLPHISIEDKKQFEAIESTPEFKEKVKNKELQVFVNNNSNTKGGFWLHLGDSRYYLVIKGSIRKEDAYKESFNPKPTALMNRERSAQGFHSPFYKNRDCMYYTNGQYKKGAFCDYDLISGADVYLILYKGYLPRRREYTNDYKKFDGNKRYNDRKHIGYTDIRSNPQWNRLREEDLKGSSWKHTKFHLQYSYLEENSFINIKDIIK